MALEELGLSVELRAELDRFQQNMQDAGRIVDATAGTMDRATKRAADSFTKLEGKLDPAAQALQRYERDTAKVQMALDKGAVSTERATALQQRLNDQYEAAVARATAAGNAVGALGVKVDAFSNQAARGQSTSRGMGVAIQQAGYQIGDFAVQVASGQGILRPFIQQGTQFISMFGPWGAVLGAAGAIAGAVATTFFDLGNSAEDAGKKGTDALSDIADQAKRTKEELEGIASYYDRIALAQARMDQVSTGTAVVAARARLDALKPGDDPIAAQRALIEAQDAQQRAYMAESGILSKLADEKDNVLAKTQAEIDRTKQLTQAMSVSRHEYDVTVETLKILADSGYTKGEKEARAFAEKLVTQREALDKATKAANDNTKATGGQSKEYEKLRIEQERIVNRASSYIANLAQENEYLELKLNGQESLIPLLKAEADFRQILGRELLPDEEKAIKSLVDRHEELNAKLKQQEELEKAAKKAAEEQERIWTHAAENIQDALADAIFSGKNLFQSLKDVALSVAKQIAAAMIFNPIIVPIIGGVSGVGSLMSASGGSTGGLGSISSLGSNLSSIWSMLNGPSTLGTNFAMSGIGQWLGLSTAPASGIGPVGLTGMGSIVGSLGNLLGSGGIGYGVGSIISSLGIGTSTGSSIGGALGGAIGSIIPGVGTIIGSVAGSLIGGLFGNDQPSDFFANTGIDLTKGTIGSVEHGRPDETSSTNNSASQNLASSFLAIEQQLLALTGGTAPTSAFAKVGSRDGIVVGVGDGATFWNKEGVRKTFANTEEGAKQAIDWMVQQLAKQLTGVTNADIQKVLDKGGTSDEIISNLTLVQSILTATATAADPLTTAIKAVNDSFDDLKKQATDLGLSTDLLTKLEAKRQEQLDEVNAAYSMTGYQNTQGALQTITGFLSSQATSDTSSLSPLAKQAAAAQQFNDLLNAVQNGDLTQTGSLTSAAQNYLSVARQNYGSTAGFSSVESYITQSLAALGQTLGSQESISDQITRAIQLSSQSNADKLDEVKAEISKMVSKLSLYLSVTAAAA